MNKDKSIKEIKQNMFSICKLSMPDQQRMGRELTEVLEEFLKIATKEDLEILNYNPSLIDFDLSENSVNKTDYFGIGLTAEVIMILGAYGNKFFNKELK